MDTDQILQDLNRRFAAPLPVFYRRRIIFWYDEEGEFSDQLKDLAPDNARVVALTGSNAFAVKKLLNHDDVTSNFLVYSPVSYDSLEDDWLLDIKLYSEEFRADLVSIWMSETGIPSTPALRKAVKSCRTFFNNRDCRERLTALGSAPVTPGQLHMAVMAVLCKVPKPQPNQILRAVLCGGLDEQENAVYQELTAYDAAEAFWAMARQRYGFLAASPDLCGLAVHLLLSACARSLRPDLLTGLEDRLSPAHQPYCYDVVSEWLHSGELDVLYEIARTVEEETLLPQRLARLNAEELAGIECFPCVDELILTRLMTDIGNHIIDPDAITDAVTRRRTCAWYPRFANYYDGLLQAANMQSFCKEHSAGFHNAQPKAIWKAYTDSYYRMDTFYRLFHLSFQRSLETANVLLDDLFRHVADVVEGLYSHWFLGELGKNWSDVCGEELTKYGKILDIPQQSDFYRSRVKSANSRVFVIISDALRYEVAASLAEQLRRETQSEVTLDSCEAFFPTVTKFGMAALLPHRTMAVSEQPDGSLAVLVDGKPTGAGYRDKILKEAHPASCAVQYSDFMKGTSDKRKALVNGMDVIYIYHDKIDEMSHVSGEYVFPACDEAIRQIKAVLERIQKEKLGTRAIITADHGFLYTYNPLHEDAKVDKTTPSEMDVEIDRRYLITRKGAEAAYLLPVKFMDASYDAFAPKESVRIKKKGGGQNFVHGGISLQEMVVPVVEWHLLKNDTKAYQKNRDKIDTRPVTVSLLSSSHKISNMIFSLNFYQREPVGGNLEPATYQVYFTDENGKTISDVQKIIADKTGSDGAERTFRCNFNLKSMKYDNTAVYYLVIAEASGAQLPQQEQFQIDIAFAVDDFDFF